MMCCIGRFDGFMFAGVNKAEVQSTRQTAQWLACFTRVIDVAFYSLRLSREQWDVCSGLLGPDVHTDVTLTSLYRLAAANDEEIRAQKKITGFTINFYYTGP